SATKLDGVDSPRGQAASAVSGIAHTDLGTPRRIGHAPPSTSAQAGSLKDGALCSRYHPAQRLRLCVLAGSSVTSSSDGPRINTSTDPVRVGKLPRSARSLLPGIDH